MLSEKIRLASFSLQQLTIASWTISHLVKEISQRTKALILRDTSLASFTVVSSHLIQTSAARVQRLVVSSSVWIRKPSKNAKCYLCYDHPNFINPCLSPIFWGDVQARDPRPFRCAKERAQIPPMSQVSCLIFGLHDGAQRDSLLRWF